MVFALSRPFSLLSGFRRTVRLRHHAVLLLSPCLLVACGGGSSAERSAATAASAILSPAAALGEKIFRDASWSASGQQSCASGHPSARQADGSLPVQYRGNVNVTEAPYNRQAGQAPALSDTEIEDMLAFLSTPTDGYQP